MQIRFYLNKYERRKQKQEETKKPQFLFLGESNRIVKEVNLVSEKKKNQWSRSGKGGHQIPKMID